MGGLKIQEHSYRLELISWSGGECIALNDYRVAGSKPWGGGEVVSSWEVRAKDLQSAIPELNCDRAIRAAVSLLDQLYSAHLPSDAALPKASVEWQKTRELADNLMAEIARCSMRLEKTP